MITERIQTLDPVFQPFVRELIACLDREPNLLYTATEWRRTQEYQDALYAQGREPLESVNTRRARVGLYRLSPPENAYTVTQTRNSNHILGLAVDICPIINGRIPWNITTQEQADAWKRIGAISTALGIRWGGLWTPLSSWGIGWDPAHHEYQRGNNG
jgi:peptidoglycan L-alanyl-D-glutamate endopeptidase CwlK